jgi:disulfide bond formation protein DsbB
MKSCHPRGVFCVPGTLSVILAVSVFALAAALIAEYAFGLKPCVLCLYQRVPFGVNIVLAGIGLAMLHRPLLPLVMLALSGISFIVNAGLAMYHSGVELRWWVSAVEGCAVPTSAAGSTDWIDRIMATPGVACTDVQWVDPVFGFTMANYNIVLNVMMVVLCMIALFRAMPLRDAQSAQQNKNT